MIKRIKIASLTLFIAIIGMGILQSQEANAANGKGQPTDWGRFYHYPYVYYPHNFQQPVEYDHMYYKYPQERRIPVYNKGWYNFYPSPRPYHSGHHYIMDVF